MLIGWDQYYFGMSYISDATYQKVVNYRPDLGPVPQSLTLKYYKLFWPGLINHQQKLITQKRYAQYAEKRFGCALIST